MLKSKIVGLLVAVLFLFVLVLTLSVKSTEAQQDSDSNSELVCEELKNEMEDDKELAELVTRYEKLLREQSLSADELAKLIAEDESEKAELLGIQITHDTTDSDVEGATVLSLCYAPVWRPGRVVWNFSNPGQYGAKYSVKPETSSSLIWANPTIQEIDGIYRSSWGSCNAYKVVNGSTATFHSAESWEVCYNAAACAAGACPKWVNPCSMSDWPNSPLN